MKRGPPVLPYAEEINLLLRVPAVEIFLAAMGLVGCLVLTLQTLYPLRIERERIVLDEVELGVNIIVFRMYV